MYYVGEGSDRVVVSYHAVKGAAENGHKLVRQVVEPDQFQRTLSLTATGTVYYIDHLPVGVFVAAHFKLGEDVYHYFPRGSVGLMKEFIMEKWGSRHGSQGIPKKDRKKFDFDEVAEAV